MINHQKHINTALQNLLFQFDDLSKQENATRNALKALEEKLERALLLQKGEDTGTLLPMAEYEEVTNKLEETKNDLFTTINEYQKATNLKLQRKHFINETGENILGSKNTREFGNFSIHNGLPVNSINRINQDPHVRSQFEQIMSVLPKKYGEAACYGWNTLACPEGTGPYTVYDTEVYNGKFVVKLHNDPRSGVGHTTRFYFQPIGQTLFLVGFGHDDGKGGYKFKNHK